MVCRTVEDGFSVSFFWSMCKAPKIMEGEKAGEGGGGGGVREEQEGREGARDKHSCSCICFFLGDPPCNFSIEAHHSPFSCVLSLSELPSPGGSRMEDTDSDNDVRLAKCGLVAVEVRKGKVGVRNGFQW